MKLRRSLIEALLGTLARMPLPRVHALGAALGWLLWRIPNSQRRIAATNLALCFPRLSAAERRWLLRASLIETGKTVLELGPLWLWPGERVLAQITAVEGEEDWRAALAAGRGGIAITPHLGAWEVAGLYVSRHYPITTLYRPSRHGIDELIRHGRERLGARTVPTDQRGVRALFQALKAGEVLGILPDQDPGPENGVFAPFFGIPAATMVLVSKLAMKQRCPVFLVVAERLPQGRGYCIRFTPLPQGIAEEPLEHSVAVLNQAVEQEVRRLPAQYLWTYKRFKSRPPGAPRRYP
ncbi:MAG TPA: lysophospholipid acyltransferase family protein [Candidatus Competibacteraceae bacterium]|nr:lysophospholipid acyltransferase family protein [Candidatus Competibacteraceae bacterium]